MSDGYDIVIVGGGPAGLSLACLAADAGLSVAVVDRQQAGVLAAPPPDGRDIALTHRSVRILGDMGVWGELPAAEVAPIRSAEVRNAGQPQLLSFTPQSVGRDALGYLVANQVLRREIWRAGDQRSNIAIFPGETANGVGLGESAATVTMASGRALTAPLIVAADSRFSELRRMAGIGAEMRDFGRVCIVCRLRHEKPHDAVAHEWFDIDQTLAVLPLNGCVSSIVLTQPTSAAWHSVGMPEEAFAQEIERRLESRWGRMFLDGARHAYPLVAVYADRFAAQRLALVGDAAVGMHPVTAHGFNFGLRGAETLVRKIAFAAKLGGDIGAASVLDSYARQHRRATLPLYLATNAIVRLYTDNTPPARLARAGLLRMANVLTPVKDFMLSKLTEIDGGLAAAKRSLYPTRS